MKKSLPLITEEELKEIFLPTEKLVEIALRDFDEQLALDMMDDSHDFASNSSAPKQKSNRKGYSKTLQDEELSEGVTYLHQKDTGLHSDIIVDCGRTYELYEHPLCLYIVRDNDVIPVDIVPNIDAKSSGIAEDIVYFIRYNHAALQAFADMEIDASDFYDIVSSFKGSMTGKDQ